MPEQCKPSTDYVLQKACRSKWADVAFFCSERKARAAMEREASAHPRMSYRILQGLGNLVVFQGPLGGKRS